MFKRALISLAAVAVICSGIVTVAQAAGTVSGSRAKCTSKPTVTDKGARQEITVVCRVPKPPAAEAISKATVTATTKVTVTATVTTTVTTTPRPSSSPTPSPTSSPTVTPTADPGGCVRPDATNTGATGTLSAYNGPLRVSTPGVVIENKVINGDLTIAADNVTVRNTRVTGAVGVTDSTGARLSRVTMREFFISSAANVALSRSDIRLSVADGIHVTSDGSTRVKDIKLTNNYIHDPRPGEGTHYDGIQVRGADGIELLCNTFDLGEPQFEYNAAVYIEPANGGNSGVVIDGNWLLGGGHIFHYGPDNDDATRLTNNHLGGETWWPNGICHTSGAVPRVQSGNDLNGVPFTPCQ